MDHVNEKILALLIEHLRGECSVEDFQVIRNWLSESTENKRFYDELGDLWNATAKNDHEIFDAFRALKQVKLQTGQYGTVKSGGVVFSRLSSLYSVLKIAAIFLMAIVIGILANHLSSGKIVATENSITEITTPLGSKTIITLPDSTKVWLNAGSKIRYDSHFNQKNRVVSLEGEAFFDVTKKMGRLFLVKTNDITVRVLGTAFNVKAYPGEGSIETTLVRGSLIVEQRSNGKAINQAVLEPNQRAILIKKEGKLYLSEAENQSLKHEEAGKSVRVNEKLLLSKQVDTDIFTAWKDNQLIFRNEGFESLAVKLARWYGVQIIIKDDEIKKYHFNGTIVNETIQDVMEIIRYTLPISYSIEHNIITIQKNPRP